MVHSVDDVILKPDFVQLMKKNKVVLCSTLIVHGGYVNTFGQNLKFSSYELNTAEPQQLGTLLDVKHLSDTLLVNGYKVQGNSKQMLANLKASESISMANLKRLSDAGVTIATGTDAENIGTLHVSLLSSRIKGHESKRDESLANSCGIDDKWCENFRKRNRICKCQGG